MMKVIGKTLYIEYVYIYIYMYFYMSKEYFVIFDISFPGQYFAILGV